MLNQKELQNCCHGTVRKIEAMAPEASTVALNGYCQPRPILSSHCCSLWFDESSWWLQASCL